VPFVATKKPSMRPAGICASTPEKSTVPGAIQIRLATFPPSEQNSARKPAVSPQANAAVGSFVTVTTRRQPSTWYA